MSVIHYSMLQKHKKSLKLPSAQTQIAYADRVSRTGAPKYFFDSHAQYFSVAL